MTKTYEIGLHPSRDLYEAGFRNDDEDCEAFFEAFEAAAKRVARRRRIEITVVDMTSDPGAGDDGPEAVALWQAIHDCVEWHGPRLGNLDDPR